MELIYVDSSNVEQIGYNESERELHVVFKKNAGHYIYSDVPEDVHARFLDASSKGTYLNTEIKGSYSYRKA